MESKKAYEGEDASLESLRAGIDECDKQIIELLARRFELARKVGRYKAIRNLPILDETRETELLSDRRRRASATGHYSIEDIFKLILEESRRIQTEVRDDFKPGKLD